MTSEADNLVAMAQKQLDEHKEWLAGQIAEVPPDVLKVGQMLLLATQARQITLRVVQAAKVVSVVWEYPDELAAWLQSDLAPKHLRDDFAGGHVVDPNKPLTSVRRTSDDE